MNSGWLLFAAAVLTFGLVPVVRAYAIRSGLLDEPGPRRSHRTPTPRGGGLAMVLTLLLVIVLLPLPGAWKCGLLPALMMVAGLGFMDDHRPIPVRIRLAVQVFAGVWLLAWFGGVHEVTLVAATIHAPWLWNTLALIALVWLINLYNFMDGSDGLAATQTLITALFFAVVFWYAEQPVLSDLALLVVAVCTAFLPWNLALRRIFMGDVGSLALGLMVGVLALAGAVTGTASIWMGLLLTAVFVVDATATLVAQVCAGQRWYTAHRQHAYQRLIASGWSHRAVVVACVLVNVGFVLPTALLILRYPQLDLILSLSVCGLLLLGWFGIRRHTNTSG